MFDIMFIVFHILAGFMVPRQTEVDPSSKPNHPPDLYDYVPASQQLTAKDQLEQDLGRQSLMLGIESNIGRWRGMTFKQYVTFGF